LTTVELLQTNLLSPVVLAFVLGALATLVRSDLEFPEQIYSGLSIYLLLAIGLKGGVALSESNLKQLYSPALGTLALGIAIPCWVYLIVRKIGRFSVDDAAALAAHYGSCSVVTFAAAQYFCKQVGEPPEGYMPSLVALLEVPAIVIAMLIARTRQPVEGGSLSAVLHETFAGRSVLLLIGGMIIGTAVGKTGFEHVAPLFREPFQGFLVLFMLELGMVAAKQFKQLRQAGLFLIIFGMTMPVAHAFAGVWLGHATGLSLGGAVTLGTLAASASYIAAPAACRVGLPRANAGFYLTASLAITFPFNLAVGIPLYFQFGKWMYGG
jgi:uncharacterized protein